MMHAPRMRQSGLLASIVLALAAASLFPAGAQVTAVDGVSIVVDNLDASIDFYTRVLDFKQVSEEELAGPEWEHLVGVFGARARSAQLQLGRESIQLVQFLAPQGRPIPVDSRSQDRWFQHIAIVVRDMGQAYQRLRAANVTHASTAPQRLPDWNPNAGGIQAFYFKDPDDHVLEVIWFPAGKGDPRWQEPGKNLFLGIDHTAIVVSNTETALKFYRDALGLRVAGESENYGTEQEHLNNVFGARLHITGLRAASGMGVEFLEYLAPSDGRPYPLDARANDLWSWQTRFTVKDTTLESNNARKGGGRWISPGSVKLPSPLQGMSTGALVRDPDGHAVLLMSR